MKVTENDTQAPASKLGFAVRSAREQADLSVRALARSAGVSHAQVSRLETGEVKKPSREILVSVSRALDRNPLPLLILAGHLDNDEAAAALKSLFRPGAELPQEWGDWTSVSLSKVTEILNSPTPDSGSIDQIALDVFAVEETDETLWDDSYALAASRGQDARQLQELMAIWRYLPTEDRKRWIGIGRKLRDLADVEFEIENQLDEQKAITARKREENHD